MSVLSKSPSMASQDEEVFLESSTNEGATPVPIRQSGSGGIAALIRTTRQTGQLKDISKRDRVSTSCSTSPRAVQRMLSVPNESSTPIAGVNARAFSVSPTNMTSRTTKCSSMIIIPVHRKTRDSNGIPPEQDGPHTAASRDFNRFSPVSQAISQSSGISSLGESPPADDIILEAASAVTTSPRQNDPGPTRMSACSSDGSEVETSRLSDSYQEELQSDKSSDKPLPKPRVSKVETCDDLPESDVKSAKSAVNCQDPDFEDLKYENDVLKHQISHLREQKSDLESENQVLREHLQSSDEIDSPSSSPYHRRKSSPAIAVPMASVVNEPNRPVSMATPEITPMSAPPTTKPIPIPRFRKTRSATVSGDSEVSPRQQVPPLSARHASVQDEIFSVQVKPHSNSPVPKPRSMSKPIINVISRSSPPPTIKQPPTVSSSDREKATAVKTLQALLPVKVKQTKGDEECVDGKVEVRGSDGLTRTERSLLQMQQLQDESSTDQTTQTNSTPGKKVSHPSISEESDQQPPEKPSKNSSVSSDSFSHTKKAPVVTAAGGLTPVPKARTSIPQSLSTSGVTRPPATQGAPTSGVIRPPATQGAPPTSGVTRPPATQGAPSTSGVTRPPATQGVPPTSGVTRPPATQGAPPTSVVTSPPATQGAPSTSGVTRPPATQGVPPTSGFTRPPATQGAPPASSVTRPPATQGAPSTSGVTRPPATQGAPPTSSVTRSPATQGAPPTSSVTRPPATQGAPPTSGVTRPPATQGAPPTSGVTRPPATQGAPPTSGVTRPPATQGAPPTSGVTRPPATQGAQSASGIKTSDANRRDPQTPSNSSKPPSLDTSPADPPSKKISPARPGVTQKKIQIKSDASWIKRREAMESYDARTGITPSQTMPELASPPRSISPTPPRRPPAPYRSHPIVSTPTLFPGTSYVAPPVASGRTSDPPSIVRGRTGSISKTKKGEGAPTPRRQSFTRSTSDDSISSKQSLKVKVDKRGSKSQMNSPPKKPPRLKKVSSDSVTFRPSSMIEWSEGVERGSGRGFASSCVVGTVPRDTDPEEMKKQKSPRKTRKKSSLVSDSPPGKKKGLLGRFKSKTQYKLDTAPPLCEEPEDDQASESSSDDEKGGTIKSMPRLRHVSMKTRAASMDQDDSELEYHQLFEYVFVVGLKDKGKGHLDTEMTYTFPPAPEQVFSGKDAALLAIPQFCFPDIDQWKATKSYKSESFSFVLTDIEGGRRFGYCRRLLPSGKVARLPECYCIVSPLGCFSLYEKILDNVEERRAISSSAVFTFLKAIQANPFPRPGRSVKVRAFSAHGTGMETVVLERPLDSRLEHVNFSLLFSTLSQRKVIQLFSSLLMERRVILCAHSLSLLSGCAHALLALLYPFEWQHVFIPVLPSSLIDFVCSPLPYIIGISPSTIKQLDTMEMDEAVVIDLEKKKFFMKVGDETSILPSKLFQYLEHSLSSSVLTSEYLKKSPSRKAPMGRADEIVVNTFMTFFAYLYGDYKQYMKVKNPVTGETEFQRDDFVKKFTSKSTKRFLNAFQMTQMFENFIEHRENPNKAETTAQSYFECHLPELQEKCQEIEIFSTKSRFDRWKILKGMKKK